MRKNPTICICVILFLISSAIVDGFSRCNLAGNSFKNTRCSQEPLILQKSTFQLKASDKVVDVNAYPDSRRKVAELKIKVDSNLSKDVMNTAMLKESVRDMEQESSQPGFWDSQEKAQDLLGEMNRVKALVARVEYWKSSCEDVDLLLDMAAEDADEAGELILRNVLQGMFLQEHYSIW